MITNQKTYSNFLHNYQHLQYGIMYHKLVDLSHASIAWCRTYDSAFFNHAQVDKLINKEQLKVIEKELTSLSRKKAIYFENTHKLDDLKSFLINVIKKMTPKIPMENLVTI